SFWAKVCTATDLASAAKRTWRYLSFLICCSLRLRSGDIAPANRPLLQQAKSKASGSQLRRESKVWQDAEQNTGGDRLGRWRLRHCDHKNKLRTLSIWSDWNTGAAAPNADDDFIYQIAPRMRKDDSVFYYTRVLLLTCEHLLEKNFCIIDLFVLREQLSDLTQCV